LIKRGHEFVILQSPLNLMDKKQLIIGLKKALKFEVSNRNRSAKVKELKVQIKRLENGRQNN
jgi:hypothetical protein